MRPLLSEGLLPGGAGADHSQSSASLVKAAVTAGRLRPGAMVKRKRPSDSPAPDRAETAERAEAALTTSLRVVARAAKKAKAFETQRAIKKLKRTRNGPLQEEDSTSTDLSQVLEAIKAVDPVAASHAALGHRLLRRRGLDEEEKAALGTLSTRLLGPERATNKDPGVNRVLSNKSFAEVVGSEAAKITASLSGAKSTSSTGVQSSLASQPPASQNAPLPALPSAATSKQAAPLRKRPASGPADTDSLFLPSLTTGFTAGDSDASDYDDDGFERAEAAAGRKNRRGQRARRAIAERKYGRKARHLQGSQSQQESVPRRAAVPPTEPATVDRGRPSPAKAQHASWEAKRKERQLADIHTAPRGRKVVFD